MYEDIAVGEDPQVEEEAMQDQAEAPEDYADDEDLYNDIVPGIGQVDGVRMCNWRTLSTKCLGCESARNKYGRSLKMHVCTREIPTLRLRSRGGGIKLTLAIHMQEWTESDDDDGRAGDR